MALTWDDIDFERGSISVTKAVTKDSDGQRIVSQPKTRRARRTVPLFGLGPLLLAHREQQAELGHDAAGTVFTTQDGRVMAPWTFGRGELQRVLKAAGIKKRITLYSFRHTFASLTLANGSSVPLTTVSRWLGHSTIKLTSDTYQHLTDDVSDGWADSHTEFLAGTDGTRDLEASMTN